MPLEGYTDYASSTEIRGWVFDSDQPDRAVLIAIISGDQIIASIVADGFRPDLQTAGKGNGRHAFSFSRPDRSSPLPLVAQVKSWLVPLSSFLSPSRYQGKFNHPLDRGIPTIETGFIPTPTARDDSEIVGRLIESYHRAIADQPCDANKNRSDMWSTQEGAGHHEIAVLLQQRNNAGVSAYLRDAHARSLTNGISQGDTVTAILRARSDARERVAAPFVDYLVSLAEFLGILKVECSDQASTWAENLYRDPQALIDQIGEAIGIDVVPPQTMGGFFGIRTPRGILSGRDLMSLHTALRLKQMADSPAVCEIGGGLGGVAYYANRLGINRYTIIDIPIINVLQGYHLHHAIPGGPLHLYGESENESPALRVLPTYCFDRQLPEFDILLNQDSMPEMHREYSLGYLRSALQRSKHLLLSVNQEAQAIQIGSTTQTVVGELVQEVGGYKQLSRARHWLRPGYVEELFQAN